MRNQPERKSPTENLEHASIRQYCKEVRTPAIGAKFVSLAEQAVKENQGHILYLEALLALECEERDRHAMTQSTLPASISASSLRSAGRSRFAPVNPPSSYRSAS